MLYLLGHGDGVTDLNSRDSRIVTGSFFGNKLKFAGVSVRTQGQFDVDRSIVASVPRGRDQETAVLLYTDAGFRQVFGLDELRIGRSQRGVAGIVQGDHDTDVIGAADPADFIGQGRRVADGRTFSNGLLLTVFHV